MLRITDSKNGTAAVQYFDQALARGDYYSSDVPGIWHGLGAARLGLIGAVERSTFATLMDNCDPRTGERLTARTRADRRPGFDLTFNAPKGVSVLHALTGDPRIGDTFREAVIATMRDVERDAKTRVRREGCDEDRVTGNMIWAEFQHGTTRPVDGSPDPHLHTHCYAINATWDAHEQTWKALQIGDIKGEAGYYEAAFLARLAHGMRQLGYEIERKGRYWDIAGIPKSTLLAFSRRTAEIDAAAAELGITGGKARDHLGQRTRGRKHDGLTPTDCAALWRNRAGIDGRVAIEALQRQAKAGPRETTSITPTAAMTYALDHAFERSSVVPEKWLLATALRRGYGDLIPEVVHASADRHHLITGTVAGRRVVTTRAILAEEQRMIEFARAGRMTCRPLALNARIKSTHLNDGQRRAVEHLWASADRVSILFGGAGTGKTTLMTEAVAGITMAGHRVAVFAPTSAARDVLRHEGFSTAETLQRYLIDPQMQHGLQGAALWIDEAGLLSIPDMAKLFAIAEQQQSRVILAGDTGQNSSVVRGDALAVLASRAGLTSAEVTEIVRQRGAYKDAVAAIAKGDLARGWSQLDAMGAIHQRDDDTRDTAIADAYAQERAAGRSVLVVSPTHREIARVTAAIREVLKAEQNLGEERQFETWKDLGWTAAERSDPARYTAGLCVRTTQNQPGLTRGTRLLVVGRDAEGNVIACDATGKRHALLLDQSDRFKVYTAEQHPFAVGDLIRITENGQTATGTKFVNGAVHEIASFDDKGDMRLTNGKTLPKDFATFTHGYATTSMSSQGRTVDTVLAAISTASLPALTDQSFYVTVSRGKSACHIFTDDREALANAIMRSGQRGSATELVDGQLGRGLKPIARQADRDHVHDAGRTVRDTAFLQRVQVTARRLARAHAHSATRDKQQDTQHLTHAEHRGVVAREAAHALDAR